MNISETQAMKAKIAELEARIAKVEAKEAARIAHAEQENEAVLDVAEMLVGAPKRTLGLRKA